MLLSMREASQRTSFFSDLFSEWKKLDLHIRKARSLLSLKNFILKTGRPVPSSHFNIYNPVGWKVFTRLWVGLSHRNKHKFKYNFSNCVNPLCSSSLELESTIHFILHRFCFSNIRKILFNELNTIRHNFADLSYSSMVDLRLYGSSNLTFYRNLLIIYASIYYVLKSERFKRNCLKCLKNFTKHL